MNTTWMSLVTIEQIY